MSGLLFFESTKDQGVGNSLQVPAQEIQVDIYRPGALVSKVVSYVAGSTTIEVFDAGAFDVGDTVSQFDEDFTPLGTVTAIPDRGHLTIAFVGAPGTLQVGQAIVPVTNRPDGFITPRAVSGQEGALHGSRAAAGTFMSSERGIVAAWIDRKDVWLSAVGGGTSWTGYKGYPVTPDSPGTDRTIVVDGTRYGLNSHGIQRAIDDVAERGGGKVEIDYAGIVQLMDCLWTHSNVHLAGRGKGITVLMRQTGSIVAVVDGGTPNYASVINVSPLGSNGSLPTSVTSQANITISDLTVDGNYTAFSSLTDVNLGMFGIANRYTDGFSVYNVGVRNTLQDGIQVVESRDVHLDSLTIDTVGQWSVLSTRNGISLYNYNAAVGWATRANLSNLIMRSIGDEAIAVNQWDQGTIEGVTVDGCDFVLEFGSNTLSPADVTGWTATGITAQNTLDYFITFNGSGGITYSNFIFSHSTFKGHASLHDGGAIFMNAGANADSLRGIKFSHLQCSNINTKDTNARRWVDAQPASGASVIDVTLDHCSFSGKSVSVHTGDVGINIRGACSDWFLDHILLKDVPGVGVALNDNTFVATTTRVRGDHVVVDGAHSDGFQAVCDESASTIEEVRWSHCVAKDCNKVGGNGAGFYHGIAITGARIQGFTYDTCRSYKTSGAGHLYGLRTFIGGTGDPGSISNIKVNHCDFRGTQTQEVLIGANTGSVECVGQARGYTNSFQTLIGAAAGFLIPSMIADCDVEFSSDGSNTLTLNPTIPNGSFDGQRLLLINVHAANVTTLSDETFDSGTNLRLSASQIALGPRDSILLRWSNTLLDWVQIGQVNAL